MYFQLDKSLQPLNLLNEVELLFALRTGNGKSFFISDDSGIQWNFNIKQKVKE